jgi:hypothetical protein
MLDLLYSITSKTSRDLQYDKLQEAAMVFMHHTRTMEHAVHLNRRIPPVAIL